VVSQKQQDHIDSLKVQSDSIRQSELAERLYLRCLELPEFAEFHELCRVKIDKLGCRIRRERREIAAKVFVDKIWNSVQVCLKCQQPYEDLAYDWIDMGRVRDTVSFMHTDGLGIESCEIFVRTNEAGELELDKPMYRCECKSMILPNGICYAADWGGAHGLQHSRLFGDDNIGRPVR
jgi:hypothetical protein